ncbi:hypothetical protein HNP52_002950 [Sphingomonas kyeonggiensis]|uniref:Rap1a immunity protein domain-containing protein n=1 Tax=Sphingomonas kyeonggiensis TaxID=1268553 RepID=A0A7W7K2M7_9SPHN|nr:Rap1a/Tai family immunity protein [Sphingomonas kyeonggiensis]MBB4839858.1 hypothetical protein [Sphingomonas kyeonggiensis]
MKASFSYQAPLLVLMSTAVHVDVSSAKSGNNGDPRTWSVSGAELIEALEGKSDTGELGGEADRIKLAIKASAYIAGVADATSATAWCGAGSILPHELADRVYTYLRSAPPELLKGRASTLVIKGLAKSFPCAGQR